MDTILFIFWNNLKKKFYCSIIILILFLIYVNIFKKLIDKYKKNQDEQHTLNHEILETIKQINSKL